MELVEVEIIKIELLGKQEGVGFLSITENSVVLVTKEN